MKTLVIGYGSIGSRHARILKALGCPIAVVSKRNIDFKPSYKTLAAALSKEKPDYVVIANKTSDHRKTVLELKQSGFKGALLIEKPVFAQAASFPVNHFKYIGVAYNLRFHPALQKLSVLLKKETIISTQVYAGSFLPSWRQADYRRGYSADKKAGGGVLRDLSHELDYLNWLLGGWTSVAAIGGHFSKLKITSDDVFCLLMTTRRCRAVSLQINYIDRNPRREVFINTDRHSYKVDLIGGTLRVDGEIESFEIDRDATYRWQHESALKGKFHDVARLSEGMEVMSLIAAAEKAAKKKSWVKR
ncbi:MAG: Gfo/Idh/MocA family oxidoreductase [Candidatus Omnitrophica bacterium]|nr:Gfo/Idh/MocA family oxidoreductase [Candidatus Omnitrophota bacterium]